MPIQRALSIKEMIERTPAKGDEAKSMRGALREYAGAVERLENVMATRDPTLPEAAHAKRIADAAKRLDTFVEKANKKFLDKFNAATRGINQRIMDEANLKPTKDAPEIRAALRAMGDGKRVEAIQTAFRNQDAATIAAIREGNFITTGLDDQTRHAYVTDYEKTYAPEATAEADAALELFEIQGIVSKVAKEAATEAADPEAVAKIEAAREAARSADSEFSESVKNEPAIG